MARSNLDMEVAALGLLEPRDGEDFLVIGFGPGVGIDLLLRRCAPRSVTGLDPSAVMCAVASRRIVQADRRSCVELRQEPLAGLELTDGPFDAAVSVNTHQLWTPHPDSASVLARTLRPGGRLVTVTHDWAIAKRAQVETWKKCVVNDLEAAGFGSFRWLHSRFRSGGGTSLTAVLGARG